MTTRPRIAAHFARSARSGGEGPVPGRQKSLTAQLFTARALRNHLAVARNFEARIRDILQRKKCIYGLVVVAIQRPAQIAGPEAPRPAGDTRTIGFERACKLFDIALEGNTGPACNAIVYFAKAFSFSSDNSQNGSGIWTPTIKR